MPATYGYWRKAGAPTTSTTSYASSVSRRRDRSAGRCPTNCGWSPGTLPAPPNDSCHTGAPSLSASSTSAAQLCASFEPDPATIAGALRAGQHRDERLDRLRVGGTRPETSPAAASLARSSAGASQSSIGTMTSAGPACGRRLVPGAADGAGQVLRPDRLVHPDGILARESLEPAGEKRLVREVAAILLADEDDERRPVDARRRERADGVAEARGRVQDRERGLGPSRAHTRSRSRRPSSRGARARSRDRPEERRETAPRSSRGSRTSSSVPLAEDVEDCVADGRCGHVSTLT